LNSVGWRQSAAVLIWLVACWLALRAWRRMPTGRIRWDGEHWYWELPASDVPGHVEVNLDLQTHLMLRWQALPGQSTPLPAIWLWVERTADAQAWPALRRAVYSRAIPALSA
jgi:hypothetical protein